MEIDSLLNIESITDLDASEEEFCKELLELSQFPGAGLFTSPRTVVFLGASGAGKTSTINLLVKTLLDIDEEPFLVGIGKTTLCSHELEIHPKGQTKEQNIFVRVEPRSAKNAADIFIVWLEDHEDKSILNEERTWCTQMLKWSGDFAKEKKLQINVPQRGPLTEKDKIDIHIFFQHLQKPWEKVLTSKTELADVPDYNLGAAKGCPLPQLIQVKIMGEEKVKYPIRIVDSIGFADEEGKSTEKTPKPNKVDQRRNPLTLLSADVVRDPATVFCFVIKVQVLQGNDLQIPPEIASFLQSSIPELPNKEILRRTMIIITSENYKGKVAFNERVKDPNEVPKKYREKLSTKYPILKNMPWCGQLKDQPNPQLFDNIRKAILCASGPLLSFWKKAGHSLQDHWDTIIECVEPILARVESAAKQICSKGTSGIANVVYHSFLSAHWRTVVASFERRGNWPNLSLNRLIVNHKSQVLETVVESFRTELEMSALSNDEINYFIQSFQDLISKVLSFPSELNDAMKNSDCWGLLERGDGMVARNAGIVKDELNKNSMRTIYAQELQNAMAVVFESFKQEWKIGQDSPFVFEIPDEVQNGPIRLAATIYCYNYVKEAITDKQPNLQRLHARLIQLGFTVLPSTELITRNRWSKFLATIKKLLTPYEGKQVFLFLFYSGHGGMSGNAPVMFTQIHEAVGYKDLFDVLRARTRNDYSINLITHDACLSPVEGHLVNPQMPKQTILINSTAPNSVGFSGLLISALLSHLESGVEVSNFINKVIAQVRAQYQQNAEALRKAVLDFNRRNPRARIPTEGTWFATVLQGSYIDQQF